MTKSPRSRYSGLPVLDRKRLARVLGSLVVEPGGQKAAAKRLGITPLYFWRLLHEKGAPAITPALFNRIASLVESDKRLTRDLLNSVATADTRKQRYAYQSWLRRAMRKVQPGFPHSGLGQADWHRLYQLLPPHAHSYITSFMNRMEAQYSAVHWNHRVVLAVALVLTPLIATVDTGGIERSWWEMDEVGELGPYLKSAFRAQELLLNREANILTRLQEIEAIQKRIAP